MHIVASRRTYAYVKKKVFSARGVSSGVSNRKSSASASHCVPEGVAKYVAAFFLASLGIRDQGSRVRAGRTCSTLLCFVFCCPFLQCQQIYVSRNTPPPGDGMLALVSCQAGSWSAGLHKAQQYTCIRLSKRTRHNTVVYLPRAQTRLSLRDPASR